MVIPSYKVEGKIKGDLPDFVIGGGNSDKAAQWLRNNFQKCQEIICPGGPKDFATKYSNLAFSRFIICNEGKDSWQDALNDVGKKFKDFREDHRHHIFETAVFGLPIGHRRMTVTCRVDRKGKDRRNSPLIIKTLKTNNGYYWLVLRLSGEFLPEGGVIYASPSKKRPDYTLIDEFWNRLKRVAGRESILSRPEVIKKICKKIKERSSPSKIILFGSRARGDAHKTADIDMAVENKDTAIYEDIYGPIDIVDMNRAPDSLKQRIVKEGVEL